MKTVKKPPIDWQQVRERLQTGEQMLAAATAENPARIEEAYRRRATELAQAAPEIQPSLSVLVFSLHQERYAVALSELAEVVPLERWTAVPGAPAAFLGVIALRGELRPLVDLSLLMQGVAHEPGPGFVLLLRHPGREVGLRVDRVEGLLEIPRAAVCALEQGKYTQGIQDKALLLLNIMRVLAKVFSREDLLVA